MAQYDRYVHGRQSYINDQKPQLCRYLARIEPKWLRGALDRSVLYLRNLHRPSLGALWSSTRNAPMYQFHVHTRNCTAELA